MAKDDVMRMLSTARLQIEMACEDAESDEMDVALDHARIAFERLGTLLAKPT